jgi:hypothetical protein
MKGRTNRRRIKVKGERCQPSLPDALLQQARLLGDLQVEPGLPISLKMVSSLIF